MPCSLVDGLTHLEGRVASVCYVETHFRRIFTVLKASVTSPYPSVRPSASLLGYNNAAPTIRIAVKFGVSIFHENLLR